MEVSIIKNDQDNEFGYITKKLEDTIELSLHDKSSVIFGFNGIGKSSFYSYLKSKDVDERYEFIEYEESQAEVIGKGDSLIIAPFIHEIETKSRQLNAIKKDLNIKEIVKKAGVNNLKEAKLIGNRIEAARRNNFEKFKSSVTEIEDSIDNMTIIPIELFIEFNPHFNEIINVKEEFDLVIKEKTLNVLENSLDIVLENNDNICPVCSHLSIDLEKIISKKIKEYQNIKSKVTSELRKRGYILTKEKLDLILKQVEIFNNNNDLYQDYVLCAGDKVIRKELTKNYKKFTDLSEEIYRLKSKSKIMYDNLCEYKDKIVQDFIKYFEVDQQDIKFEDDTHSISIKLPRNSKKYSTGERNLMYFLFQLYSFLGSERNILIIDDPVSSLDIINHYKIAYEIIRVATMKDKRLLIFTHSVELINTLNSQYPDMLNFYYLEEDNKLKLQCIETRRITNNLITLQRLTETDKKGFIQALVKKENANITDDIHKVFHYYPNEYFDELRSVSNHQLVDNIENYSNIVDQQCFIKNSLKKIEIISSLRVYLEKKLYDLIENEEFKNVYLEKNQLMERVNYLLPRNGTPKICLPIGIKRDYLVSKKVFLNQGIHYQSQVMPFAYAINISIKELNNEVNEFRNIFCES